MSHFTRAFRSSLPLIEIEVGVGSKFLQRETLRGNVPHPPFRLTAMVDTGASSTIVDRPVLQRLRLSPSSLSRMQTPSTAGIELQSQAYDVDLHVLGRYGAEDALELLDLRVTAAVLDARAGFQVLLGRDVLRHCVLTYNGTQGWLTLAW